jgi:hypothetical protein
MKRLYPGTSLSDPYFCGKKSRSRSAGSVFSHASRSSCVGKYSSGGLYDSECVGRRTLGAGRAGGADVEGSFQIAKNLGAAEAVVVGFAGMIRP